MKGMVVVGPQGLRGAAKLKPWIEFAIAYVETLPPKVPKKRKQAQRFK